MSGAQTSTVLQVMQQALEALENSQPSQVSLDADKYAWAKHFVAKWLLREQIERMEQRPTGEPHAWVRRHVAEGAGIVQRLYNETPNVSDAVAAGAWMQVAMQLLPAAVTAQPAGFDAILDALIAAHDAERGRQCDAMRRAKVGEPDAAEQKRIKREVFTAALRAALAAATAAQPHDEQVEILQLEAENALTSVANDLQASYDSDGITEQDSGAPLVYLATALAAVESARQEFRTHGAGLAAAQQQEGGADHG